MRLGISSLGHLVDKALRGKFKSMVELLFNSIEASLNFAERYDIEVVEIILDPPEIYNKKERDNIIDLCNAYSIEKQVHAPFTDVSLCSFNQNISDATVKSCIDAAEFCQQIGAEILTVHPGVGHFLIKKVREFNNLQLVSATNKLLDATSQFNVKVCMENMPKDAHMLGNVEVIRSFLSRSDRDDIYFTFDTSHAWTTDMNQDLYWKNFHSLIKNVHLADNNNKDTDLHPALGDGKVDFSKILNLANEFNYEGVFIIEIITGRALRRSIKYINSLI
ncbi:MAG: TIM barrel protein [Candidatus Lokiarchaeota archaeon]|nr:TIM barrel protein [Candidatus Lokiarchaeota archaeon]MBD3341183.1 TIM barrel protein [Candidatus Lokiarchaeota archaeon]